MNTPNRSVQLSFIGILFFAIHGLANAQVAPGTMTFTGQNVPQEAARMAINASCPNLVGPLSAAAQDLATICTAMVTNPTATGFQWSDAALSQALQTIAHEEVAAQGRGLGESPDGASQAIRARLFALRSGEVARLGALQYNINGKSVAQADSLRQRGGGAAAEPSERLGAFVNAGYHTGDRDATSREDAFDFDNWGLVAGVDYRFRSDLVGGIALNYSQTDIDLDSAPGPGNERGEVETDTYGISFYGTYYRGAFYLDAHANYSRNEFDNERRIEMISMNALVPSVIRTAKSDPDGDQFTVGFGAGYNIPRGALTITPYGRLEYLYLDIDGYTETGAIGLDLKVDGHSTTSLQSALGAQLAYAISTGVGVFSPQLYLEWNHEFENGSRSMTARFVNDPFNLSTFTIPTNNPDRDFLTLGVGVSGVLRRGLQGFVNLETVQGLSNVDVWGVIAGVRLEL